MLTGALSAIKSIQMATALLTAPGSSNFTLPTAVNTAKTILVNATGGAPGSAFSWTFTLTNSTTVNFSAAGTGSQNVQVQVIEYQ